MDTMIPQGYSKAKALFKGYKPIWGGLLRIMWRLRRNWKYLYENGRSPEDIKPATFYSEICYHSNSQRLM